MSSLNDFVEDYSVFDLYNNVNGKPEVFTLNDKAEEEKEAASPPALRRTRRHRTPTFKIKELSSQGKRTLSAPTHRSKKMKSTEEDPPVSAKSCNIAPTSDSVLDRTMANAMDKICTTVARRREETRKYQVTAENLVDELRRENEAKICLQNQLQKLTNDMEKAAEYQVVVEKNYALEKENHRIAVERVSVLEKELMEMKRAKEMSDRTIFEMKQAQEESDKTLSELQDDLSYLFSGGLKDLFYKFLKSSEFSARIVSGLGKAFVLAKEALVDPAKKKLIPGCFEDVRSGHYTFFDHLHPGMSAGDLKSWELDAAPDKSDHGLKEPGSQGSGGNVSR